MCATTLVSTTVFTSLEFAKRALSTLRGTPSTSKAPLIDTFLGGCFSGMVVSMLTSPLHRVKVQLQAGSGTINGERGAATGVGNRNRGNISGRGGGHTIRAAINCGKSILQHEGIHGLYLGWRTQLLSETIGRGVYFGTYDTCKRLFWTNSIQNRPTIEGLGLESFKNINKRQEDQIPLYGRIISGAVSGVVGWTVIYPIDVVKNRIQAQVVSSGTKAQWLKVAQVLYLQGGLAAFYRGWSVMVVRALPVSSIALPTYDIVHHELEKRNQFY